MLAYNFRPAVRRNKDKCHLALLPPVLEGFLPLYFIILGASDNIFRIPCNLEQFGCTDRRTVWLLCMSEEEQDV